MSKNKLSPQIVSLLSEVNQSRQFATFFLEGFNKINKPEVKAVSVLFDVELHADANETIGEKYAPLHKEIFLDFLQKSSELYSRIALEKETEIATLMNQ